MGPTREVRTGVGFEKKAAVEALEGRRLLSVSLPRDVNAVSPSAATAHLTDVGGTLFFTTDDGASGQELWKTDGTEAGTVLVKDIRPGSAASVPNSLLNLNGTLLFAANDGASGAELWRSDGTAAGTTLLKDIFAGGSSSTPFGLVRVGGVAYFFARAGSSASGASVELWSTDGTAAGTSKVADVTGPLGYTAASVGASLSRMATRSPSAGPVAKATEPQHPRRPMVTRPVIRRPQPRVTRRRATG